MQLPKYFVDYVDAPRSRADLAGTGNRLLRAGYAYEVARLNRGWRLSVKCTDPSELPAPVYDDTGERKDWSVAGSAHPEVIDI